MNSELLRKLLALPVENGRRGDLLALSLNILLLVEEIIPAFEVTSLVDLVPQLSELLASSQPLRMTGGTVELIYVPCAPHPLLSLKKNTNSLLDQFSRARTRRELDRALGLVLCYPSEASVISSSTSQSVPVSYSVHGHVLCSFEVPGEQLSSHTEQAIIGHFTRYARGLAPYRYSPSLRWVESNRARL